MTKREVTKDCIIYPENPWKKIWDVFVSFVLIACVFWTPWEMCFNISHPASEAFNWIIDTIFLCDMIVVFFSAF